MSWSQRSFALYVVVASYCCCYVQGVQTKDCVSLDSPLFTICFSPVKCRLRAQTLSQRAPAVEKPLNISNAVARLSLQRTTEQTHNREREHTAFHSTPSYRFERVCKIPSGKLRITRFADELLKNEIYHLVALERVLENSSCGTAESHYRHLPPLPSLCRNEDL
jgi:hypothetical protein